MLKQFDYKAAGSQCKSVYEILRLLDLYDQVMDKGTAYPNFYISNLSNRSHIGLIKSGYNRYESDVKKIRDIVPPDTMMPELQKELAMFSAEAAAKVVIRDSILKEFSNRKLTTFS